MGRREVGVGKLMRYEVISTVQRRTDEKLGPNSGD